MKAIFEQFDRVVDFPHQVRGRVDDDNGTTIVRIYDPRETQPEFSTDLFRYWDRVPGLKDVAIEAFIAECTKVSIGSHDTRRSLAELFKRLSDFFVDTENEDRHPGTLTYYDCEDILGHIASLDLVRPDRFVAPLRLLVDRIWAKPEFDGGRDPHLFIRKVPFPGSTLRGTKREVLPDALWGDIYAKAATDVSRIMADVNAFRAALSRASRADASDVDRPNSLTECAVWVYCRYGNDLPSKIDLKAQHPGMAWHVTRLGGWKKVLRLIHPTLQNLMPFIVLLACQTLFNKAVLTEFSLDDIRRRDLAGTLRLVLTPLKKRAGKQQLRSFQIDTSPDNPDVLLRFLEQYTAGLRQRIDKPFERRVFLFWSLVGRGEEADGTAGPAAFNGLTTGTGSEDSRFTAAWAAWCERNGFEGVSFPSLRSTGLNLVHRAFGGDVRAVAALGSHSSYEVFDHHYKSAHSRARNERRMGKAMMLRGRMLESGGKIDPTRRLRGEGVEAATPGFGCLDPMASPIPGQREGRTCTAYGQCPACPLATTNTEVPANLVRLKQMEAEYVSAVDYLAPHYWRDKYSQHLGALRAEWLPAFTDPRVIEDASRMQARPLPPLG